MRRAVLLTLLVLTSGSLTQLTVDAEDPPQLRAGQRLEHPLTVGLEGPTGSMPGLAGPVELALDAPSHAGCELDPAAVLLDPLAGQADATLACRPTEPGEHPFNVTARSPPHAPGSWNGSLTVRPDVLTGTLSAGSPEGFEIPLRLEAEPIHLDEAPVNATLTARLAGTPLGIQLAPIPLVAEPGSVLERSIRALHGPGTYQIQASLQGDQVEAMVLETNATIPEPPSDASFELNVTVEPGEPSVELTSDGVNDDGKRKRPGDTLITRLQAGYTGMVEVTVYRVHGEILVPLSNQTVPVDGTGEVEHTFSHPILPTGRLIVQAQAGNASVARTARILDLEADAHASVPGPVLGDGRAVPVTLRLEDPNHGSLPTDPGPIFGLPDLDWRLFRGSRVVEGWTVTLGPFAGGPEGTLQTSAVPWPGGLETVEVGDGWARVEGTLDPPEDVAPGRYRLSIYAPDGDRVGGTELILEPPPSIELSAGGIVPGTPLPVTLNTTAVPDGFAARIELRVNDTLAANATVGGNASVELPVPAPLQVGTPIRLEAWANWAGRPQTGQPDASWVGEVPEAAPVLAPSVSLDGVTASPPIPLHPASAHTLQIAPSAFDPNGEPIDLEAQAYGPDGAELSWETTVGDLVTVHVPAGIEPGRYTLELSARAAGASTTRVIELEAIPLARLALEGPDELSLTQRGSQVVELGVSNLGTRPFTGLLADLAAPEGLSVHLDGTELGIDGPVPLDIPLDPGDNRTLELQLAAPDIEPGSASVQLRLVGVLG